MKSMGSTKGGGRGGIPGQFPDEWDGDMNDDYEHEDGENECEPLSVSNR